MTITYVETDGGRLAIEVEGKGPLVVCSPGMGDSRDAFAPLSASLVAQGYRVLDVTARDFDLSGGAATIAAGRRPELVSGLVLIGPYLRNGMGAVGRAVLHAAFAQPWGPAVWRFFAAKLWPGLGDAAKARAAASAASLTRPGRWAAFHKTTATDHRVVAPWIARVQAPVLVVMGDKDPDWKDPLAEARWVASSFSEAQTLTVPGAGHAPMLERPGVVGARLLTFLENIRRASLADEPIRLPTGSSSLNR